MIGEDNSTSKPEEDALGSGQSRRKIPGGMPYTSSSGVLGKALEKLPITEKPGQFTNDFLSTVMEISGWVVSTNNSNL